VKVLAYVKKMHYFCNVKILWAVILLVANLSLDDIILDIYNTVSELGETDFEQVQSNLYALHEQPIDLNHTSEEELAQLYFLSPHQIDELLLYADRHPMEQIYELKMIPSLTEIDIRNLIPFVRVSTDAPDRKMYAREVFAHAQHEIITRVDARNIEGFSGSDPMYVQTRYRFDYQRRVIIGGQLRRPPGGDAQSLEYGAYLQLNNIGVMHTLVAGNFQASFGQGLVLAPVFHSGKSAYVAAAGQQRQGLRYYASADGAGLHGIGGTLRWEWDKQTRLDVSALYSLKRANDSTWHHMAGANLTVRHKRMEMQVTAIENIWSDSIHPYYNAKYNRHYFRGYRQAVIGASMRYNHGWFDAFCEVAASENRHWGAGVLAGSRFYPTNGVSMVALYRYYSPWFDNALGYGFSETSRIGDEHGGYLGVEVTRLQNWRFSGYADVFYFSGPKYGIPKAGTVGYDVLAEAKFSVVRSQYSVISTSLRLRARKKGEVSTYSTRWQWELTHGGWNFRTTADGNYVQSYGVSVAQDIGYAFASVPLNLRIRGQFFDAKKWENRIYLYEHDVLYAFSIPATYGFGGRMYVCLKWQVIKPLALYLRASETIYTRHWAAAHDKARTRTDVHLLLRAKL